MNDDSYKLPNVQDKFAMLSQDGSTPDTFSVIDLASAFNQLFFDDESSELLTINTFVFRCEDNYCSIPESDGCHFVWY